MTPDVHLLIRRLPFGVLLIRALTAALSISGLLLFNGSLLSQSAQAGTHTHSPSTEATSIQLPLGSPLGKHLSYVIDTDHQLSITDIINGKPQQWLKRNDDTPNFSYTDAAVWLKLEINTNTPTDHPILLEVANEKLNNIEIHLVQNKTQLVKSYKSGIYEYITDREYKHRNFLFSFDTNSNEQQTLYIKADSTFPLKLPVTLWETADFYNSEFQHFIFQGIFFGWAAGLALYNLFLFLLVRDKNYLIYFAFTASFCMFHAIDKGLAYQYIWPNHPELNFQAFIFFTALTAGLSAWFTDVFLHLEQKQPQLHKAFVILRSAWWLLALWAIMYPTIWVSIAEIVLVIPGGSLLCFAGIYMWRKGSKSARYYTIAWTSLIIGSSVFALTLVDVFPTNIVTSSIFQVTTLIELTLLSLGLASRIKTLDKARDKAQAETKAKSLFLAQMSHEIRTPMNGVLGMSELLSKTKLDSKQMNYLDIVRNSGESLLGIINDILDYSKIEAGKLEIEKVPYNLETLMEESLSVFSLPANKKGITLISSISHDTPVFINGDSLRVRQILLNLLSNAFKFTKEGNIILRAMQHTEADKTFIRFEIQDSGIGISVENQAKLFSSYAQAESSTSRKFGGTGLGLTICKQLSELMGGNIGLSSVEGKGTTFWFTIEYHKAEKHDLPALFDNKELTDLHLLIVEDNVVFADFVKEKAQNWGMKVSVVYDIDQAYVKLKNNTFDLISLDESLPGGCGLDFAKDLKNKGYNIPIMLITGHKSELQNSDINEAGITLSHEKPISSSQLQRCFSRALGHNIANEDQDKNNESQDLNMKILVAEDNQVNQLVIKGILNKFNVSFDLALDGCEALNLIKENNAQYDCILMDCEMPNMDGYEATRKIRQWEQEHHPEKRTPIIALSAHAMAEQVRESKEAGMDDHISKPIKIEVIYSTLKIINEKRQAA